MNNKIATPTGTKSILDKYKLRANKRLGQNFLIDRNIIEIIIKTGAIKDKDIVIEIGPGIGALTQAILENLDLGSLIVIEKDEKMVKVLKEIFCSNDNLEIIKQDVLEINFLDLLSERGLNNKKIKVLANLPYYITTPIIIKLLESRVKFSKLIFMVQKEVAERMIASPGTKDYGRLSIIVQYYAQVEIEAQVSPKVFIPQPSVNSSIISLNPHPTIPYQVENEPFFFQLVKAIFQQRRKNIKNALSKAANFILPKEEIIKGLKEAGIATRIRGEKLTIKELAHLSNILFKYKQSGDI